MSQARNPEIINNTDNIVVFNNVLKSNVAACSSIGTFFVPQISRIFTDMMLLYQLVSTVVSQAVAQEGMKPQLSLAFIKYF